MSNLRETYKELFDNLLDDIAEYVKSYIISNYKNLRNLEYYLSLSNKYFLQKIVNIHNVKLPEWVRRVINIFIYNLSDNEMLAILQNYGYIPLIKRYLDILNIKPKKVFLDTTDIKDIIIRWYELWYKINNNFYIDNVLKQRQQEFKELTDKLRDILKYAAQQYINMHEKMGCFTSVWGSQFNAIRKDIEKYILSLNENSSVVDVMLALQVAHMTGNILEYAFGYGLPFTFNVNNSLFYKTNYKEIDNLLSDLSNTPLYTDKWDTDKENVHERLKNIGAFEDTDPIWRGANKKYKFIRLY